MIFHFLEMLRIGHHNGGITFVCWYYLKSLDFLFSDLSAIFCLIFKLDGFCLLLSKVLATSWVAADSTPLSNFLSIGSSFEEVLATESSSEAGQNLRPSDRSWVSSSLRLITVFFTTLISSHKTGFCWLMIPVNKGADMSKTLIES